MRAIDGYDVVVVGGGPGGLCAAVAAGRSGARTLLIEREGCLGGGATTMLVHPFMPHRTYPGPGALAPMAVNAGLFREIADRLDARGAAWRGWNETIGFDEEAMKVVLDELAGEAGVRVIFHAALFDAEAARPSSPKSADGRVLAVRLAHNEGPIRVTGKVFVDGTGDGLLAHSAGAQTLFGNDAGLVMPMTLNFIVGGVQADRIPTSDLKRMIAEGGQDTPPLINTHLSCWTVKPHGMVHFNAIRIPGSTLDVVELSEAEAEGRRRTENFVAWLRAKVPGFEGCYLAKVGSHIGIRESRRVVGDYLLVADDFSRCAKFDDAVACCSYQVDIHGQKPGETTLASLPPGEHYQIPYRCLTPKGLTNLLMASRSISADVTMHSSLRIMPVVMNLGEAAGYAAAMSLPAGDVRGVDVQLLRQRIRRAGGVLEPGQESR